MENIKEKLSDVLHHYVAISVAVLFLFTGQPEIIQSASALVVKPDVKTEAQLNKEKLEEFSNTVWKPSESLTDKELVELLKAVGFEGSALKMAWAVAKKESNGRPMAYNGNRKTGDSSYGIFQINMLGNLGDDRKEKFKLDSNYSLFDPAINAEITYYMTNGGQDWSSWKGLTAKTKEWISKFPSKNQKGVNIKVQLVSKYLTLAREGLVASMDCPLCQGFLFANTNNEDDIYLYCLACNYKKQLGLALYKRMEKEANEKN